MNRFFNKETVSKINQNSNDEDEEPNFFEENEENDNNEDNNNEDNKNEDDNKDDDNEDNNNIDNNNEDDQRSYDNNHSSDDEDEKTKNKKDKSSDLALSMVKDSKKISKKIIEENDNNILGDLESDHNSKSDDKENEEEPNFYAEENIPNEEEHENEAEEEINEEKARKDSFEDKFIKKNNKKIEDLKKKDIEINNIYEINKLFNYDINNPVFYLKENKQILDKYPWPLSTKQVVRIVEENNIPYENLRVKLVDLFEFKLKSAFEYVDFMYVIKPEWASNVTYSKIFLDLYNFKNNKDNNINSEEKKEDKKEDKKEENKGISEITQSKIPNVSHTNTFSIEKRLIDNMDEKEDEKEKQPNNYNKNYYPRKKNRRKKRGRGVEIRGNFGYYE